MSNLTVFVQEEYGYREWIWKPNMTKQELQTWWDNNDPEDFFFNPSAAPGKWTLIETDREFDDWARGWNSTVTNRAHFHEKNDSWLELTPAL